MGSHLTGARFSIVAIGVLCAACQPGGGTDPLISYDSAGVRIDEIHGVVWEQGDEWTLSSAPLVQIGVSEGDSVYELYGVVAARRLSNGHIVVGNGGTGELRVFDGKGEFVRAIGRAGGGPGEFQSLWWLQVLPGDTLLALDGRSLRATAFTSTGELIWSQAFANASSFGFELHPEDIRLSDGSYLLLNQTGDAWGDMESGTFRPGEIRRNSALLVGYSPTAQLLDTLAVVPGYEEAIVDRDGGRPGLTFPLFGRLISHALAGDRIYVGTQESFEIREYATDGALIGLIRRPDVDLTITEADLDKLKAPAFALSEGNPRMQRGDEEYFESTPQTESRPAYGWLVIDAAGRLWISEWFSPLVTPERWSVFEPGVGLLGDVIVPERFTVYEIGLDYILGRWTDEDGVEYVHLYALEGREN